jgi:hypothetical protein
MYVSHGKMTRPSPEHTSLEWLLYPVADDYQWITAIMATASQPFMSFIIATRNHMCYNIFKTCIFNFIYKVATCE